MPSKKEPRVIVSLGQHSSQSALAMQKAGLLQWALKGLYVGRRVHPLLDARKIKSFPLMDAVGIFLSRTPFLNGLSERYDFNERRVAHFDKQAARFIKKQRPDAVIAFDTCCVATFEAARSVGAVCILDQSIGHLSQAVKVYKQYGIPIAVDEKLSDRSHREVELADHILAGSEYVRQSLLAAGVPDQKIVIQPYGVDTERFRPGPPRTDNELRLLFVGRVNHRKGIQNVFEAFKACADIPELRLWVAGPVWGSADAMKPYGDRLKYFGQVPHAQLHEIYQGADIFVYPSLHEGSTFTVYEALSAGLPVITTFNSGTVVQDGQEGFIVGLLDTKGIIDKIRLLQKDPELRRRMGQAARSRALAYSWDHYHRTLAERVKGFIDHAA